MKNFNVFYDVEVNGKYEEKVITVYNCLNKSHAIRKYKKVAPEGAFFRAIQRLFSDK